MFSLALRHLLPILGLVLFLASSTEANAEKVIFTAPDAVPIPLQKPSLADLNLPVLTPDTWSIRTNLSRVFPTEPKDYASGAATWLLLDSLNADQRYEFRVCWAAIVCRKPQHLNCRKLMLPFLLLVATYGFCDGCI